MYKLYIEDFEKNSPRNKKLVFIDFQYLNSVDDNNKTLIAEVKFITEEIEFLIYKNGELIKRIGYLEKAIEFYNNLQ